MTEKRADIRQNTILGMSKTYKEKQKKTGKVTEIEMGLELNHVYWWPETRLTFGGSCPLNALNRRLQQRKHRVHLSQPTVLEYSWFHFSDRREASLLKNTVASLAIPQLVESIYKWGKRTVFYFKVVLPLLFPHVFCRWQKEIVVHWMERKDWKHRHQHMLSVSFLAGPHLFFPPLRTWSMCDVINGAQRSVYVRLFCRLSACDVCMTSLLSRPCTEGGVLCLYVCSHGAGEQPEPVSYQTGLQRPLYTLQLPWSQVCNRSLQESCKLL